MNGVFDMPKFVHEGTQRNGFECTYVTVSAPMRTDESKLTKVIIRTETVVRRFRGGLCDRPDCGDEFHYSDLAFVHAGAKQRTSSH